MGTQAKDRSRINIYLNDELKVKNIRKADIGYQTVLLIESSGLMSENVFTFLRNNNSCGFQLLKKHEEVTENEKQYRRYRVNNEPELIYKDERFYVARNWGINNISSFIDACQSRLPQLNFEID
jgi:hypothetical protein